MKKRNLSIGAKLIGTAVIGLAIPICIFIGSFLLSMGKVADESKSIISERMLEEVKNSMEYSVQSVVSSTEAFFKSNQGKMSETELHTQIMKQLNSTGYGEAGYFFAYDYSGIRVLAPENPAQVGTNMWDKTDVNGIKTTQSFIEAAKKGGDFVTYTWLNPDTNQDETKVSYVKSLKLGSTEYALGTGTYLPMIQASQLEIGNAINRTKNSIFLVVMALNIVIVLLILLFVQILSSRVLIRPIKKLVETADSIADGNLDISFTHKANDEIGRLSDSFSRMAENLNMTMNNINNVSEQVASGSKQLSESSISLSKGATEQASSVEELTASLEEIASQTQINASNAVEANEIAKTAKTNAETGNGHMKEMLKAIGEINNSSTNISKIIKVIDDIAFQTNILALNATVEAARAGQHGKGFAVVAEEVRNLAIRSANAAKETTAMIETSIEKAQEGAKTAKQTADALGQIVGGIGEVAHLVEQIATASNEQASGISQINQGVLQVSQVVQTNSANAEESAAASEQLASQAEMLKEQVDKFKLKKVRADREDVDDDMRWMFEHMSELKRYMKKEKAPADMIELDSRPVDKY